MIIVHVIECVHNFLSIVGLPEIRKNFYIEDPDVANMHPREAAHIRYWYKVFCFCCRA